MQEGPNPDPGPGAGWPVVMACSLRAALPPHLMAAGTQSALLSRKGLRGLTPQAGWEGSAPPGVRKDELSKWRPRSLRAWKGLTESGFQCSLGRPQSFLEFCRVREVWRVQGLGSASLAPSSSRVEMSWGKFGLWDCPCPSKTPLEERKLRTSVAQV